MNTAEQLQKANLSVRRSSRAERFTLERPMEVITRPFGMRFYTFWLNALNISRTGFFLAATNEGFIPYKVDNKVHATIDMRGSIFERPLHMTLRLERETDCEGKQGFGCSIVEIADSHASIFAAGLATLGESGKFES